MSDEQTFLAGTGMDLSEKIDIACEILREFEPEEGYYLCFSGGKDSIVLKQLAVEAGVKFDAHYNLTTIDPPELVRYIKKHHPEVTWNRPKRPFFAEVPKRGLPTAKMRWCCDDYKEGAGNGGFRLLGVRAAESPRRKKQWKQVSFWKKAKNLLPMLYWSDDDIWAFIRDRKLPYCSLYDEGFGRLGCVGCPLASESKRREEFARWPRYEKLWRKACHQLWDRRKGSKQRDGREWFASAKFKDADDFFEWWIRGRGMPKAECDMGLW